MLTFISDCLKPVSTLADNWKEHQCFDLKSCLVDKYDNRVLHNLKFRWLQFGSKGDFYVDEFILIDTSVAGFGNFEGENLVRILSQSLLKPSF